MSALAAPPAEVVAPTAGAEISERPARAANVFVRALVIVVLLAIAVVAARARVVEGAVGMVEMALTTLSEHDVVDL
ncbi:MAG: SPFH domain-containing protein, partial [Microbacterium sp.]